MITPKIIFILGFQVGCDADSSLFIHVGPTSIRGFFRRQATLGDSRFPGLESRPRRPPGARRKVFPRGRFLKANTHFVSFFELSLYKIYEPLHRAKFRNLNFAKNSGNSVKLFQICFRFAAKFKITIFQQSSSNFAPILMKFSRNFAECFRKC